MSIPRDFIDQLLSKIDLIDLINVHVPLQKKSGNNYFARCPFHQEKSASFSVSQQKQFYYCFGCGAHGNAIDFLIARERLPFREAIESLARIAGMEIPEEKGAPQKNNHLPKLYDLTKQIADFYYENLKKSPRVIDYLKKRGITGKTAQQFQLGYADGAWSHILDHFSHTPEEQKDLSTIGMIIQKKEGGYYDRFRDRLMFPILDYRGRYIGFGGRIIDAGEPKYLNSPETPLFQKGHELYGLYHALKLNQKLNRVMIVEGYMDVIALFQHHITYAVATLGTATTEHHFKKIFRYTDNIIFCFDGDNAGRTAAWRALTVLLTVMQDHLQIKFLFLPEGEDPDSLVQKIGKDKFEKLYDTAPSLSDFFFQELNKQCDTSSMEGRARLATLSLQHIKTMPEGFFRELLIQELNKRTRVSLEDLKKQLTGDAPPTPFLVSQTQEKTPDIRLPYHLKRALSLLIQHPELASAVQAPMPELALPGHALLRELIAHIKKHPHIHTGMIIELFREHKMRALIIELSHLENIVPPSALQSEFLGAIATLKQLEADQVINQLMAQMEQGELSQSEKQRLSELIAKNKLIEHL